MSAGGDDAPEKGAAPPDPSARPGATVPEAPDPAALGGPIGDAVQRAAPIGDAVKSATTEDDQKAAAAEDAIRRAEAAGEALLKAAAARAAEAGDAPAGAVAMSAAARAKRLAPHLPSGTVVDQKYSIERVIGEGGMGVVYLAEDIHTRTPVVLKAIRAELAHRKDVRERTLAEGRALAQIDHPNVVHLNAVVVEGERLWLVMQYIDGESLERRIQRYIDDKRPMPVDEVLQVFRQIVAGVSAIHREGMIHRDLKPANVLIRAKDGAAKVTDFGIAKIEDEARAGKGMTMGIIGSLCYMSPEQVTARRDLDKRVDVYALGIVLFELLVGRVPFDGETEHEVMRQHIHAPVPMVSRMRRDVPAAIDAIIQKACAKDRADRFADAGEILRALDALPAASSQPAEDAPLATTAAPTAGAYKRDRSDLAFSKTEPDSVSVPALPKEEAPKEPERPRPKLAAIVAGALALAVVAAGALALLGVIPGVELSPRTGKERAEPARTSALPPSPSAAPSVSAAGADASASTGPTAKPAPSASAAPKAERSPLEELAGAWTANGRDLEAVVSGDELEFRVRDPAQFDPQGYEQGEARFALLAIPGETRVFTVEDRVRPIPPAGKVYDAKRSRSACREIWTSAGGAPLRATFDGTRLTVEFVKIEPSSANFMVEKGVVTSCIGLRKLSTSKVVSSLSRVETR